MHILKCVNSLTNCSLGGDLRHKLIVHVGNAAPLLV